MLSILIEKSSQSCCSLVERIRTDRYRSRIQILLERKVKIATTIKDVRAKIFQHFFFLKLYHRLKAFTQSPDSPATGFSNAVVVKKLSEAGEQFRSFA